MSDFVRLSGSSDDDIDDLDTIILPEEKCCFTVAQMCLQSRIEFSEIEDRPDTAFGSASESLGDDISVVSEFLDSPMPTARSEVSFTFEDNLNNYHGTIDSDETSETLSLCDTASDSSGVSDGDSFVYNDDGDDYDSEEEERAYNLYKTKVLTATHGKQVAHMEVCKTISEAATDGEDVACEEVCKTIDEVASYGKQVAYKEKKLGLVTKIKSWAVEFCCVLLQGKSYDVAAAEDYDAAVFGHAKEDYCCEANQQNPKSEYENRFGVCVGIPPEQFIVPISTVDTVVPRLTFVPNCVIHGSTAFPTVVPNSYIDMNVGSDDDDDDDDDIGANSAVSEVVVPEPKTKRGFFRSVQKFFRKRLGKHRRSVCPK